MAGTIRKRGDSYQVLLSWRDPETGRTRQVSATRKTKREAEQALAELMVKKDERKLIVGRETFEQLVERYLGEIARHKAEQTYDRERRALTNHFAPLFPKVVKNLTPYDFDRLYSAWNDQGQAATTQRQNRSLAHTVMDYGRRWGWCAGNPVDDSRRIAPPKRKQPATFTPDELERLLATADDKGYGLFFRVLATTGARRNEACALQWGDVDFATGILTIRRSSLNHGRVKGTKTDTERTVQLDSDTLARLRRHRAWCAEVLLALGGALDGGHFIFSQVPDQRAPLGSRTANSWLETVRAEIGLDHLTIRDLRHTVATLLLANGLEVTAVADVLGHTNAMTTLKFYAAAVESGKQRASDIMERMVRGEGT